MTVSTLTSRVTYTADGVETVFTFDFASLDADWIFNAVDGVPDGAAFVSLNVDQETSPGGTVTFPAPPANGAEVVIFREAPVTQETDYPPYTRFPSRAHESALDKLTMIDQQQDRRMDDMQEEIDQNADDIAQNAADIAQNAADIDQLELDVADLEADKADKTIEILSDDTDLIVIINPTLADNVTISPKSNVVNGLVKLDASGLIPVGLIPPFPGNGDFMADGSVPMTDALRMIIPPGNTAGIDCYYTDDGGFRLNTTGGGLFIVSLDSAGNFDFPWIFCNEDSSVGLAHSNSIQLLTRADGVEISENIWAGGFFNLGDPGAETFTIDRNAADLRLRNLASASQTVIRGINTFSVEIDLARFSPAIYSTPGTSGMQAEYVAVLRGDAVGLGGSISPLVIGTDDPANNAHVAIGANGVQAKDSGIVAATLELNPGGGEVAICNDVVVIDSHANGGPRAINDAGTATGRILTSADVGVGTVECLTLGADVSSTSAASFTNLADFAKTIPQNQMFEVQGVIQVRCIGGAASGGYSFAAAGTDVQGRIAGFIQGAEDGSNTPEVNTVSVIGSPDITIMQPPGALTGEYAVISFRFSYINTTAVSAINFGISQESASANATVAVASNSYVKFTRLS